jgi:hypothetical protein
VTTSPRPAGRLLSVNVGLPRDVSWHGRTVHTAVWKEPVSGARGPEGARSSAARSRALTWSSTSDQRRATG